MKGMIFIVTMLFLTGGAAAALSSDIVDHEAALRLRESGDILSLDEIIEKTHGLVDGHLIEAELEHEDKRYVYELEFLDQRGTVREIYVNAKTGEVIKVENGD